MMPVELTLATIFILTDLPTAKVPIFQIPVSLLYLTESLLTKIKDFGSRSFTLTLCATSGPLFLTVNVHLTRS